ncbi:hypothetical protein CSC67_16055 [Pusillimonas caeni]|uniref:hypothetical protein n=1 Tax=Pusillimonas caeni TaxID=1348472 RepID=UPI000E59961B|nr:hypothetical protein [Pusillimonas caeni]TFL11491.1 hypothetical protein CSC67_16055 [Pusillimonas caeni]
MNHRSATQRRHVLAICALSACLFSAGAFAANGSSAGATADIEAKYRQDIERCNAGQTNQDVATCKREAGAALQEARRQRLLTHQEQSLQSNATARCQSLPAGMRDDCMAQMSQGSNTTVQGSIAGGGILRTTEITIPGGTETQTNIITPNTVDPSVRNLPRAGTVQ